MKGRKEERLIFIWLGWIAIKPVLIQEKVYREYCTDEELQNDVAVCFEQELRLNFMFTTAAVATNVCAIPRLPWNCV